MILAKGWFRRRALVAAQEGELVVDLFATELEGETEHGRYFVQRAGDDWCVKFRPVGSRLDQRDLAIDALDELGEHRDWPTRGCASEAVNLHARLMQLGYGVLRATELVAQRSQRVAEHQRVPTLSYEQPVSAGARP